MVWAEGHEVKNGRYVIQNVLGQGGFGITYKAWDTFYDEFVALKTPNEYLKHDPDYQKYVDRFVKESKRLQKLTKLSHPHIVKFGEFFQEGKTYCLVMEYVAGKNFFEIVRERERLPQKEAVKYIKQIASALVVIHKAGLVHRDAHPGNIILQGDSAILIDFGIAKELVPTTLSSTGDAGNRGFAPYEQIMKGSREKNADVYCLAATLYYLVTGQRPISSFARKIDNANLIPPRKLVLEVSKNLNKAIIKGMELEAKNRPQSVEKWLQLLELQKQRKKRVIPWHYLGLILITYSFIGAILLFAFSSDLVWIVTTFGAIVIAWNWSRDIDDNEFFVLAIFHMPLTWPGSIVGSINIARMVDETVVGAIFGMITVALAGSGVITLAGSSTIAAALTWTTVKLVKNFKRFHIFLILAITSLLGLGLGGLFEFAYKAIFNS
ncbi:MAG: serine/threonine-protein kinase [Spirulinaceae cyanobacterium]